VTIWVPFALATIVAGALAECMPGARRRRDSFQKVVWGVPRVTKADPYADECWRFGTGVAGAPAALTIETWGDLDMNGQ
jgi:hypothetical protein